MHRGPIIGLKHEKSSIFMICHLLRKAAQHGKRQKVQLFWNLWNSHFRKCAGFSGTRLSGVSSIKTNTPVSECCPSDRRNDVFKDCNVRSWRGGQMVWEGNEVSMYVSFEQPTLKACLQHRLFSWQYQLTMDDHRAWFERHTTSCEVKC